MVTLPKRNQLVFIRVLDLVLFVFLILVEYLELLLVLIALAVAIVDYKVLVFHLDVGECAGFGLAQII